ncbi:unnamed protein product [Cladocopium goreaui]|uniref:Proton/sulfate cotransporter 2 n=1 Tax=Cladocopium goreaui TaxID=2562237 RepID=A0A9P1CW95_9DINO|nr:unnamed protein product [Cladocopium goreaui]
MGVFRLAFLVRFLSKPALSGFITASAILIMLSQVKPAIGLPRTDIGGIMTIFFLHPTELRDINPATVILSLGCLAFLHVAKRFKSSRSRVVKQMSEFKEVLLLVIAALIAWRQPVVPDDPLLKFTGHDPSNISWNWKQLVTARVDHLLRQVVCVSSTFERRDGRFGDFLVFLRSGKEICTEGYQVVATNELLGLGAANLAGAFCGAVPTQIGLSRMGIASSMGVKNLLGTNVFVAGMVAIVLLALSPYIYYVPRCALNVIIIVGASSLTEFKHVLWLWSLRSTRTRQRTYVTDLIVWWVAFLFTLFLGALKGILGAVVVSLVLIVYQVADPPITTLGYCQCRNRWMNVKERRDTEQRPGILAVRPEGPLFYANIERLEEWLDEMEIAASAADEPLMAIILSFAAVSFLDTSALEALQTMIDAYSKRNIGLLVAHASGQPCQILKHALGEYFPEHCLTTPWSVEDCHISLCQADHSYQSAPKDTSNIPKGFTSWQVRAAISNKMQS